MKANVREHFEAEVRKAQLSIAEQEFESAWTALQRAHILGQTDPLAHAIAHWQMLKLGWQQRDLKETAGQILPTIVAIPVTLFFGWKRALRGGRVNVSYTDKPPIPEDLRRILEQ
jgi:Protein of unknown function (DUF3703)